MSKKVLVISSSLRPNSNSEALADAFAEGAASAGNEVEKISLRGKNIGFCRGCLACQKLGHCVINDDAPEIAEKMLHADVLVFATPIYCRLAGTVFAGGVDGAGEIAGHPALEEARAIGAAIK